MQIQKDDVRDRIVGSAKKEFLENGMEKASMRNIAKDSQMTVGNLYRYFKNKDDLMRIIVEDTLGEINEMVLRKSANTVDMTENSFNLEWSFEEYRKVVDSLSEDIVDIYLRHKIEFNILMMHSKLNDEITDWFTSLIKNIMKNSYGVKADSHLISKYMDTLAHSFAVSIFTGLRDIFYHSDLEPVALKRVVKVYLRSYINNLSMGINEYIGE